MKLSDWKFKERELFKKGNGKIIKSCRNLKEGKIKEAYEL